MFIRNKKHMKCFLNKYQCCIIRSVPTGTDGKSRTGMLTGTSHLYVPPRPKSRPVPAGKLVSTRFLFGPLVFFFFFFSVLSQPALCLFYSKTFVGFGFWWWWEEELSFSFTESEELGLKVEEVGLYERHVFENYWQSLFLSFIKL